MFFLCNTKSSISYLRLAFDCLNIRMLYLPSIESFSAGFTRGPMLLEIYYKDLTRFHVKAMLGREKAVSSEFPRIENIPSPR